MVAPSSVPGQREPGADPRHAAKPCPMTTTTTACMADMQPAVVAFAFRRRGGLGGSASSWLDAAAKAMSPRAALGEEAAAFLLGGFGV